MNTEDVEQIAANWRKIKTSSKIKIIPNDNLEIKDDPKYEDGLGDI